jgi:hypothetical protein
MEPLTFDYKDLHLRVDRGVFEAFNLIGGQQSYRIPLQWLAVQVFFKKPGKPGVLMVGSVEDAIAPLYGTDRLDIRFGALSSFQIPVADEPLFREFFTKVAALADRRVV